MLRPRSLPLLFILLVISTLVRTVCALYSNMPFSNDSWPLIEIASLIRENYNIRVFDLLGPYGHHVKWPFSIIYSVVFSITTDMPVIEFYKGISGFITGIYIALITYVLGSRIFHRRSMAFLFSLSFSIFPSFTLITSQFLKETYAYMVMLLMILIFQLRSSGLKYVLLLGTCSISLLLGHVITLLVFSASLILFSLLSKLKKIWSHLYVGRSNSLLEFIFATCLLAVGALYNFFILKPYYFNITLVDVVIFGLYILGMVSLITTLSGVWLIFASLLLIITPVVSISMLFTGIWGVLIPLLIIPFPLVFLAGLGRWQHEAGSLDIFVKPLILAVFTLTLYISTYFTIALSILHRFLNYLVYPFAIYTVKTFARKHGVYIVISLLITALISTLLVLIQDDPLLFYWKYSIRDEVSRDYIKSSAERVFIYGDVKYSYMDKSIFNMIQSSEFINTCKWLNSGNLLIYSRYNLRYGFPLSPIDYLKLDTNIFDCSSLLYNAGSVFISGY